MSCAFVFPGQGSQAIGMGQALFQTFIQARDVFEEVDDALSQNLSRLIFEGDEETLTLTANTQPALMVVSMAAVRVVESESGHALSDLVSYVAGHSLGEYAALAAAGSIGVADTARLLRLRGEAMQDAVPAGEGGMAALLGADMDGVLAVVSKAADETGEVCVVANDNAPGQIVISGTAKAIDAAQEIAKASGFKRAIRLQVSAPFHSPLMEPAAQTMAEALAHVEILPPTVPVVSNVPAQAVSEPARLREYLVQQIPGRVRWRESIEYLKSCGVSHTIELGAGRVLSGLTKRIDKEMTALSAGTPEEIEAVLTQLLS